MTMKQVTAAVATEVKCVARPARPAWLRNAGFDSAFIGGGVALALLSGTAIVIEPSLFYPILLLDLWVLGYHHVIATFTRLCFDRASFDERRWMIVHLLPMVAVATPPRRLAGRALGHRHHLLLLAVVALRAAELGCLPGLPAGRSGGAVRARVAGPGNLLRGSGMRDPSSVE